MTWHNLRLCLDNFLLKNRVDFYVEQRFPGNVSRR